LDYSQRERDIAAMYLGTPTAKNLIKNYKIDYIVIGPLEFERFKINRGFFIRNYPIIIDSEGTLVFDTRSIN
jgi:uncharacterized membrane protein